MKEVWKNKWKIIEGIWNSWFPSAYVTRIASKRALICASNKCGYNDEAGVSPKVVVKGSPACALCGCKRSYMVHSLSKECSLSLIGLTPLWKAEMSEKEEQEFQKKTGITNQN
jgi:hypothetical protein